MNISDYRLLKKHFGKIPPAKVAQAQRAQHGEFGAPGKINGQPEEPNGPPEYPAPIEIPNPTEIPSPVPGDTPTELPVPEKNPTPEIEPPKERLAAAVPIRRANLAHCVDCSPPHPLTIRIQQINSRRTTLIRFLRSDRAMRRGRSDQTTH